MKSKSNKENLKTEESQFEGSSINKLKCDHLESLIFNAKLFTENSNMQDLKRFLKTNYSRFSELVKSIDQLEAELQSLKRNEKNKDAKMKPPLEGQSQVQLLKMNIQALEQEELQLLEQIKQKQQALHSKTFYHEYQCMLKEKDGLINQNNKLRQNLPKQ